MTQLIEKYMSCLRYERNYSPRTEISYLEDLRQFADFTEKRFGEEVSVDKVDADIVRQWIMSLMESGISGRSVNRKLSALKSFYRYLMRMGVVASSPLKKVVGPKMKKPIPAFVNSKEMDRVLDDSNFEGSFADMRAHLILELFYATGIRRAELIGIKDEDIDFFNETVQITGKRNKQRLIPLSKPMLKMIKQYMDVRNEELTFRSGYLFVKDDGEQLYPMFVHRLVHEHLQSVGTLSKTSPHVLRHSFATGMLNNGADLNAVKELLGHSSLASTEVYTHTSFEELKSIYKQAHPRAGEN
ncbi:tyrosine-type recombinase/integrase [Dysgonomonas massiliensis]|uniref:tyrosine-type recombinase/integrase n=1 Tax=Dysgonomonas massiliensis TaxID=2040292 RepID=UPI000C790AB0|nr:tyrosine-type recombinase/integrase [Dysgonomonas massiliensis]